MNEIENKQLIEDIENILYKIANEGFDYAVSNWGVDNPEYDELRVNYQVAAESLRAWLRSKYAGFFNIEDEEGGLDG